MATLGRVDPRYGEEPGRPIPPSASDFPYKALNFQNHEIRILVFHRNYVDENGASRIAGTLENVSLIDAKPYTALSYCWGPPASDKSIRLLHQTKNSAYGGWPTSIILITDNLHRALDDLWARRKEEKEVRVWVDALCINQNNLYERSQQVQMMRQIYSRAKEVIAWVGPTVGIELSSTHRLVLGNGIRNLNPRKQKIFPEIRDALIEFFNLEYWRRVWIIQELTVASKVKVLYGGIDSSWDDLVSILRELEDVSLGASHLLKFRNHWIDSNKPISLQQAMIWTLHTKATDPRDKIFALLGLCHDGFRLVPVPNYKQTVESVLYEMSKLSFSRSRNLDMICLKGVAGTGPDENIPLPSWVPNWPNLWTSPKRTALENLILESTKSLQFDPVLAGSSDSVLRVEAVYFGSISGISTSLQMDTQLNDDYSTPKSWLFDTENLREESQRPPIPSAWGQLRQRGIWKTLTMTDSGLEINDAGVEECFKSLWTPKGRGSIYNTRIIDWLDKNASFQIGNWTLREWSQYQPENKVSASKAVRDALWSDSSKRGAQGSRKSSSEVWDSVNRSLEQVLVSGMRLAELRVHKNLRGKREYQCEPALVSPGAEVRDMIYFIKGCRFPVCLNLDSIRDIDQVEQYTGTVRGGAWLSGELGAGIGDIQDWCKGRRTTPPDGSEVYVLDLI